MHEALPKLIDVDAVAEAFGRSRWSIYRLAREGKIPSVRLGRSVLFEPEAIRERLAEGRRGRPAGEEGNR